jgi:DNA polymerase III delta prime subunit
MSKHEQLLTAIRNRKGGAAFGRGILTADRYVDTAAQCVGVGMCRKYFGGVSGGPGFAQVQKDAASKLVYSGSDLEIEASGRPLQGKLATASSEIRKLLKAEDMPVNTLLAFTHVLTSSREDRDGDILETKGALPDPKMPLLWQHIHTLPIGKAIAVVEHTPDLLRMATVLFDLNELTSDAAKLIEAMALRFSHGFRALEFEERTKEGVPGFRVTKYEIMEESLVSVPSNVDAELELFSRGKLKSDVFKAHAKSLNQMRTKKYRSGYQLTDRVGEVSRTVKAGTLAGLLAAKAALETPQAPEGQPAAPKAAPCGCDGTKANDCGCGGHVAGGGSKAEDGKAALDRDVFATQIDAESRGEVLGCLGAHQRGDGKWMPCASPDIYRQYAGPVESLPKPSAGAAPDGTKSMFKPGDGVQVITNSHGDMDAKGQVANIHSGPVYAVRFEGGIKQWYTFDELKLTQGTDGDLSEVNEASARPAIKSMAGNSKVALRKMFDMATERLEPANIEIEWAARFIGCGVKDLHLLATGMGGAMRGGFMAAMDHVSQGSKVADTRNLNVDGTERPPVHETVDIKSTERRTFLTDGVRFYVAADGWKYVVRTYESWHGQDYLVYTEDATKGQKLIDDAWEWLDTHNPLKGEAFALAGGFLKRTGAGWDDVFLNDKNEKALKRTARIINEKGKAAANRGLILAGPPGTGKTLSARVMMNEAAATYIWVSAKDFYHLGRFGCFTSAFSMARKLAPAVILFEDVDNYIDDYTVDLLKSEMDGLAQSSGVTTFLTTNFPDRLPSALVDRPGRFHDILEIHLPDKAVRVKMLEKWATGATAETIADLAEKTDGLSGAHIYELAHYAKTIQDEDSCDVDSSLVKALEKVNEQRELITDRQLAGNSYRLRSAKLAGNKSLEPFVLDALGEPILPKLIHGIRERYAEGLKASEPFMVDLAEWDAVEGLMTKAGRVLSQRNYDKLHECLDDMDELIGMEMPRPAKAMCERVKRAIEEILDGAKPDEQEPEETADAKNMGPLEAAQLVLDSDDADLLAGMRNAIDAVLRVKRADAKASKMASKIQDLKNRLRR